MKKRIFTAIDISDEAREKVLEYVESLRRQFPDVCVGWEKPEKLHLTLKFFGKLCEKEMKNVEIAVGKTARLISVFNLKICSNGIFPNLREPKILWLDVKDELNSLILTKQISENECSIDNFARKKRNCQTAFDNCTLARIS